MSSSKVEKIDLLIYKDQMLCLCFFKTKVLKVVHKPILIFTHSTKLNHCEDTYNSYKTFI